MPVENPDEKPIVEPEENQDLPAETENGETEESPRGSWFSRRNLTILALVPIIVLAVALIAAFFFVRLGYAGRYIEARFVEQMDAIGVRTEIGKFETTFSPLGVVMRDVNFYDKATNEKLAYVKYLKLDATVTDLYALNLNRTIRLDSTEVEGLEAWVKFDEEGRSNFSRLKIPEQEESRLRFNYNTMKFALRDSVVHYGDARFKISGEARNVALGIEPDEGLSESEREIENRRFKFDLSATNSTLTYDDKAVEPIDFLVRGVATETYAEIAELNLKSPVASSKLSGRLENWEHLRYKLNVVESNVDLQRTAEIFKTEQALRGFGSFSGTVEGEGDSYKINGEIVSEALAADNVRLKGLRVNASVAGEKETYEANGKAIAEMLTYGDFQLNALQLAGRVMGTGSDFRWLGDLTAAAARFPDGTIGTLMISDAVAEYRDNRLDANFGSASAATIEAFDAKVRNLRTGRARITNAGGATDATIGTLRADSITAEGANLRGINAANVRVRDREGSPTNVEIGSLQASELQAQGVNVNGLNAGNVNLQTANGSLSASADNLAAGQLRAKGANVRDLRASGVGVNQRGNRLNATAQNVTAGNVQAEGANIKDLRASNINVEDSGNQTNVVAQNLQIGGVQTSQAVLGSLNIGGVRLKILDSGRIEGTSSDINAGTVTLARSKNLPEGGRLEDVRLGSPVFVVESSGRYRASLDLSLGGGALGSVRVGAARASVVATSSNIELSNLNAQILEGQVVGNAVVNIDNRGTSQIAANFENLDVSKLLALSGGQVVPVAGRTNGNVNLTFPGTNYRAASGTLNADFVAEAGNDERGRVPLAGKLGLRATDGLFDIETANLKTANSELNATGRFDLEGADSNLEIALNSTDAKELQRLISALNVAPELDSQLAANKIELAGNLDFKGTLTGNLQNPSINGRANLASIRANNQTLGSLSTNIAVSPTETVLRDGVLAEAGGGEVRFDLTAPRGGTNNIEVDATLTRVNAGNILAALPSDSVPDFLRRLNAETSGRVQLRGLPGAIEGTAELNAANGTISGERFDDFAARVALQNNLAQIERFTLRAGEGIVSASGTYNTKTEDFNLRAEAQNIPASKIRAFLGENAASLPAIGGVVNLTASGTGNLSDTRTFDINFDGAGRDITIDGRDVGSVTITGRTQNQQLNANLTADINGQRQVIAANVNLADENLPFRAETTFNNTDLAPFAAIFQQAGSVRLAGRATGNAVFAGNLRSRDAEGKLRFSTENLQGSARFTELILQVEDVALAATNPLNVSFTSSSVTFDNAQFTGSGSNLSLNGTAIFGNSGGQNNLVAKGTINLRVLNAISNNQFFGGLAEVDVRFSGSNQNARLVGTARLDNATFTTIVSDQRLSFTNLKGRVIFNSNQAQIESLEGRLGGGTVVASGGLVLENLRLQRFRLDVRGNDITAPLPRDFRTTGDAEITLSGIRRGELFSTVISGAIYATRAEYTRDIDLSDVIGTRPEGTIAYGTGEPALGTPQLDLRIEGRDALVVRNNLADLRGSVSIRVTGDVDNPILTGRVTATEGTIVLLRNERYDIQRGSLDFAGNDDDPIVNLQAEGDIAGYQVFLSVSGSIAKPEDMQVNVRSNPALPQADVVSLITTGNLTDTEEGIPTLAQTGLNTTADVLTEAIINQPIRRATDRLFGLNRFSIDPVLAGRRGLNPGARLTVGRQINRNLLVTYSTNLSEDRNQILALEYRVSNRLSFVAQYEQAPLTNVTRRQDNFSFEVRFRRRF